MQTDCLDCFKILQVLSSFILEPEENEKSEPFSNRKQVRIFLVWWARVDSNHRSWKQQIYSLSPLATREHAHILLYPPRGLPVYITTRKAVCQPSATYFIAISAPISPTNSPHGKTARKSMFPSGFSWSWWQELNLQPTDYKSVALPLRHTSLFYCFPKGGLPIDNAFRLWQITGL
jgi:hypothetical protein